MSEKNIYQRVNAVMQEVEYIKKDAEVQGYKAVTHDMVTAKLRGSLVKYGIVVVLQQESGDILVKRDKAAGVSMHLYSGYYSVNFVNIDKPDDFITVKIESHAADNGDKAPGKAASYATKHAMLKLFSLETGENDESREAEPVTHTQIQKETFDDLLDDSDALGLTCFSQTVGGEVMASLVSSFEKGKKSSGKEKVRDLIKQGFDDIKYMASEISALITAEDPAVSENISELSPIEKKLVAKQLTKEETKYLRQLRGTEQ